MHTDAAYPLPATLPHNPKPPRPAQQLCDHGYSPMDIIVTVFRVVRNSDLQEFLKLEFLKVGGLSGARQGLGGWVLGWQFGVRWEKNGRGGGGWGGGGEWPNGPRSGGMELHRHGRLHCDAEPCLFVGPCAPHAPRAPSGAPCGHAGRRRCRAWRRSLLTRSGLAGSGRAVASGAIVPPACVQEVGFCHMRIGEGVNSRLQLSGLLAKLCKITMVSSGSG